MSSSRFVRLGRDVARSLAAYLGRTEHVPALRLEDPATVRRFFDEHGWALLHGAVNDAVVARLRDGLLRAHQTGHHSDVLSSADLEFMMRDPAVVELARTVLGPRIVYFGDSTFSWTGDPAPGALGFHKDCADKENDPNAPDWRGDYPIVRIALYLQDYQRYSGGLAVRDRSHLLPDVNDGLPLAMPSRPGDLTIWSLRTTHSGFVSRPRGLRRLLVPLPIQERLTFRDGHDYHPEPFFRPAPPDGLRPVLFITYAAPGPALDRYLRYLTTRRYAVETWRAARWSAAAVERLRAAGVEVVDMPTRARDMDPMRANEHHVPLPAD